MSRAVAGGTWLGGTFQDTGANALARHFHKAEMRNPADLNARPIRLQAVLELLFNRPVVAVFVHVDEVDNDQSGQVAQTQLPGRLFGSLQVCLQRRVLDRVFARRAAGIDVDGDKRLGLVDDDIAAGSQRHLRRKHRIELRFHAVARENRRLVLVGLDVLGMARHEHAHEVLSLAISLIAGHQNGVDFLGIKVADRPFHKVAFLVDEPRRG